MAKKKKYPKLKGRRKDALNAVALEAGLVRGLMKRWLKTADGIYQELGGEIRAAEEETYGLLGKLIDEGDGYYPKEYLGMDLFKVADILSWEFKDDPAPETRKEFLRAVWKIDRAMRDKRELARSVRDTKIRLGLIR